jgi:hypothetical protein
LLPAEVVNYEFQSERGTASNTNALRKLKINFLGIPLVKDLQVEANCPLHQQMDVLA